jgi:hypothetical protein
MNRDFTVVRRRANLVDIVTPKRANVQGYRLKAATNFDLTFNTLVTGNISTGHLDSTVDTRTLTSLPSRDQVRLVFDPANYSGGPWNLVDTDHIWLQFFPVDFAGVEGTGGNRVLIIPDDEERAAGRIIIRGVAPSGASVVNSLHLDLPYKMRNIYIRNNEASGGDELAVATRPGGAERLVAPQEEAEFFEGGVELLMVRGVGGTANFTASMTNLLPL